MSDIKKLRNAKGLSQEALANLAKTSQPQIRRLEKGERKLTKDWAERLAPHLGTTPESLLFPDIGPVLSDLRELDPAKQAEILSALKMLVAGAKQQALSSALESGVDEADPFHHRRA